MPEKMERGFQQAIEFITQGRSISHVGGDLLEDATARLLLALTALNFSARRRQLVSTFDASLTTFCHSLLDDAEEQCYQVLITCRDTLKHQDITHDEKCYLALAYLIRVFIQRSALERLSEHNDTALREQAIATHLCQGVLDTLNEPDSLMTLLSEALSLRSGRSDLAPPILPQLPRLNGNATFSQHYLIQ